MKFLPVRLPARRRDHGFVLIVVLVLLVLVTALVIGFLVHATTQTKSVTSYSAQTGSLLLGDVAVNLVKAQIDDATAYTAGNLWASQPGAIRVLNSSGAQTLYKLYSSKTLKQSDTAANLHAQVLQDLPIATDTNDWNASPVWTDLNAPAIKSDGTKAYPIVDVVNDNNDLPIGTTQAAPFATGSFNIDSSSATNPIGATRASTGNFPLPMPARWLYVLKQGQIIVPDSDAVTNTVTFKTAATVPSATNPIVGRVAFWTDDDTCRVNVNTASHGTFWDTPHFTSTDDYLLGSNQPLTQEYQRYAGHPATTTLSLALPEFATGTNHTVTTGSNSDAEALHALSPRYNVGGSVEGTVATTSAAAIVLPKVTAGSSSAPYRLFSSIGELLFDPPGPPNPARTASTRLNKTQVETAKFFLTAHSRAPELNLFGVPRVAIWPVSTTAANRTASDQLIAFCSTTPNATYYFTRQPYATAPSATGSNSPTSDVNIARNGSLLGYLDTLTSQSLPGNLSSGATFDSKYTALGTRQILTEIFDYIRITNSRDPGPSPSNTGASSYSYAAPTTYDPSNNASAGGYGQIVPTQYASWGTYGFGRYQGIVVEASIIFVGVGQGIPAGSSTYNGNYHAVSTNQVVGPSQVSYPPTSTTNPSVSVAVPPAPVAYIPPPGDNAVMAVFVLTLFDPASGYSRYTPYIGTQTSGLMGLTVSPSSGQSVPVSQALFPFHENYERLSTLSTVVSSYSTMTGSNPGSLGGLMDFRMMLGGRTFTNSDAQYPSYSNIINMPTGGMFHFSGGSVTITTWGGGGSPGTANVPQVHQYTVNFPAADLPVPNYSSRPTLGGTNGRVAALGSATTSGDRLDMVRLNTTLNGQYVSHLVDFTNDTVISMVPSTSYGDYRMLAQPVVPASAFVSLYDGSQMTAPSTASKLAYGFMYPSGQTWTGSVHGKLVNGASYYTQDASVAAPAYGSQPIVPVTVKYPKAGSSTNAPPDFDNGFGELPDGPFINKPDEGAVYPSGSTFRVYYDNAGYQVDTQNAPNFYFSPQRQIPSPVMFGSLPSGAPVGSILPQPWQTLLFQPGFTGHAGLAAPKDEYLLDLFWMPQAQPYAISEPFSTAGKINLNYQILPFTYIDRSTALQSVLSSEMVAQVGTSNAGAYKNSTTGMTTPARQTLNLSEVDGTLRQFATKFQNFDFFKAPAEICDVYLVPKSESWTSDSTAQSAWYGSNYALVGDNTREKPYADIYSRLTTQSNTFTVYYRAQTLKNTPANDSAAQWVEAAGRIQGDYRGSTALEHYIDPNDSTIPDYATAASGTANLASHYKWRVIENNRFAP